MHVTGDLLSAASLLTALVGLLYSTWLNEIKGAAQATIPLSDVDPVLRDVRRVLWTRAMPLFAAAAALVLLLLPPFVDVLTRAGQVVFGDRAWHYNAVGGCFVAAYLIGVGLAVVTASSVWEVRAKLRRLRARLDAGK